MNVESSATRRGVVGDEDPGRLGGAGGGEHDWTGFPN
jgi:hypothetical protein